MIYRHAVRCACLLTLVAGLFALSACGRNFYMSESEAAGYSANLQTASQANQLFASLQSGRVPVVLYFEDASPVPRLHNSNLGDFLRAAPTLRILDATHQISLDRLKDQLQQQLDPWLTKAFSGMAPVVDGAPSLTALAIRVQLITAPAISYDSAHQAVGFNNLSVRITIDGHLAHDHDPPYTVQVVVENLHLSGRMEFSNPFVDAADLRLHLDPPQVDPGGVTVIAPGAPDQLKGAISQALLQQLMPIDASRPMVFDNFSLFPLRLDPAQPQARLVAGYLPRPRSAGPNIDVVARASDGKLYHARRFSGAWQDFAAVSLPLSVGSDPALVTTGADRLELAAVSSSGELIYSSWRDGSWGNIFRSATPKPGLQPTGYALARPALLATAPGQIEIIALGGDGNLWHLRRKNGLWTTPALVPMTGYNAPPVPPMRDVMAVQAGSQVALIYVDSRNLLYGNSLDIETGTWRKLTLGNPAGGVRFAPAAVSCDSGRVDLVYVDHDGHPYHQTHSTSSNGFTSGTSSVIDGTLSAKPVLACSGFQQLEMIGQGTDGFLYHNHFVGSASPQGAIHGLQIGPGWRGWLKLENFFDSPAVTGKPTAAAVLSSTWSGEVTLASLSGPNIFLSGGRVLWNSFDSRRFGVAPWTAVDWRGFAAIGTRSFVGTPALATSDRTVEVGTAFHTDEGDQFGFQTYLGGGIPGWGSFTVAHARFSGHPSPVFSGPGRVDVFSANADGVLSQTTALNNHVFSNNVPGPLPSSNLLGVSAVSAGPGTMDVVTVSNDHSIQHRRFLNGQWQGPTIVPGAVESAPVLVSTGAGQMELFAIDRDHRLYRWRFASGAWAAGRQVPSAFRLSPALFTPQAASSWGDGTVDLVVVSEDGVMYHTRAVPAAAAGSVIGAASNDAPDPVFTLIGGKTTEVPALTALTRNRLSLLAIGTDGYLYQNLAGPRSGLHAYTNRDFLLGLNLQWPGFKPLSSEAARLGGAVRLGDRSMSVLAEDAQGHLYWSQYTGSSWTGFSGLPAITQDPSAHPVVAEP